MKRQIYTEFPAYFKAFALIAELRNLFEIPPPAYHDALDDQPPEYDEENSVARARVETTGPAPAGATTDKKKGSLLHDPNLDVKIDFEDNSRFRQAAKKKKNNAKKKANNSNNNNSNNNNNNAPDDNAAGGGDDGGDGAGAGGDAGEGAGGGGDDDDEKKRKEEEEEQKRKEEEEQRRKEEEEEAKAKEEAEAAANANLSWADEANDANAVDDWAGFTTTSKKKKKKKGQVRSRDCICKNAVGANLSVGSGASAARGGKYQRISGY